MLKPKLCPNCGGDTIVKTEIWSRPNPDDTIIHPYIYCPKCTMQYHPGNLLTLGMVNTFMSFDEVRDNAVKFYNKAKWDLPR